MTVGSTGSSEKLLTIARRRIVSWSSMERDSPTVLHAASSRATETLVPARAGVAGVKSAAVPRRDLRRKRDRTRRELMVAVLICAGLPTVFLASLWGNLTEPFGFNEQWRAYYISNSGNWWAVLKDAGGGTGGIGAPFPAGWYFLERISGSLFGSTELALRLPTAAFLPLSCVLLMLLARRWMSTPAAVVVALLGTLIGSLVSYAVQLSEYQIDAAATVAVVLLHDVAADDKSPSWRAPPVYLAYGGIALACVFSTPAVFIAGPLLLLDAVRAVRGRRVGPPVVAAVAAGAVILAHLELFVLPQNANDVRNGGYWAPNFMPHHGLGNQVAFVWDGLWGFVTEPFTRAIQPTLPGVLLSGGWTWALSVAVALLLCLGVVDLARSTRGRTMLFAIGGSLALTLVASYLRDWPFGFVRTNFYLIPLLILIAGIGAVRSVPGRWRACTRSASAGPCLPPLVAGVAVFALIAVGVGLAATDEVAAYHALRTSTTAPVYGNRIGDAVATVRAWAKPGAAVVVAGAMAIPGWKYYQYEYTGKATQTGPQIASNHVDFVVDHGSPSVTEWSTTSIPGRSSSMSPKAPREVSLAATSMPSRRDASVNRWPRRDSGSVAS